MYTTDKRKIKIKKMYTIMRLSLLLSTIPVQNFEVLSLFCFYFPLIRSQLTGTEN